MIASHRPTAAVASQCGESVLPAKLSFDYEGKDKHPSPLVRRSQLIAPSILSSPFTVPSPAYLQHPVSSLHSPSTVRHHRPCPAPWLILSSHRVALSAVRSRSQCSAVSLPSLGAVTADQRRDPARRPTGAPHPRLCSLTHRPQIPSQCSGMCPVDRTLRTAPQHRAPGTAGSGGSSRQGKGSGGSSRQEPDTNRHNTGSAAVRRGKRSDKRQVRRGKRRREGG